MTMISGTCKAMLIDRQRPPNRTPLGRRASWRQKRQLYTPQAKQVRVVSCVLVGVSQRAIARDMGIDRDTVGRILSQAEVQALGAGYRGSVSCLYSRGHRGAGRAASPKGR